MARKKTLKASLPGIWRIVRRFWPQIRKQRWIIAASMLALIAETCLRLLEPWPLKFIFDRVIITEPGESASGFWGLGNLDPIALLTVLAAAVVLIVGLRALMTYVKSVGFALAGNRVLTEVRGLLYRHMQRLSLTYHSKARAGDLNTRVIGDVGRLKEVTITAALPLAGNFLTLAGMVAVMFWLNWEMAVVAVAVFPLFLISMIRFHGPIQKVARRQRERESAMASTATESFGAIKVVQALSLEGARERIFSRENKADLKQGVKGARLAARLKWTVDVLVALGTALLLWYGTRLVIDGSISPGDLLVFITYLKSAFRPVRDLTKYSGRIAKATASGLRVLDVLDREPAVRDAPDASPAPTFHGAARFEGVSFSYEPGKPVLRDLNFAVRSGQRVALAGPSGAGKSTLISLLLRLYDPTQGRVLFDGHDIREYTLESVRVQVSVVLQESVLFAVSARENIAYAASGATDAEIEAAARLANAHEFIEALPEGYETILGERGATLSGGERQRIAIARAVLRDARIVVLDEPATGLDEENERAVGEALRRLCRGRTTFVIGHDLRSFKDADLILYLESGRMVEHGTHVELVRQGGRYAAVYAEQNGAMNGGVLGETPPVPSFLDKLGNLRRYAQKLAIDLEAEALNLSPGHARTGNDS